MTTIRAVCFDAFGTVVEITDRRNPFKIVSEHQYHQIALWAMTRPIGIRHLANQLDIRLSEAEILHWQAEVEAECASVKLRPKMRSIWNALKQARLKIAVCSNLAAPYAQPLMEALPATPDSLVMSFQFGLMKPHKDIYSIVASQLGLRLSQILFVGDRLEDDIVGPTAAGASAMPIGEFETAFGSRPSIFAPPHIVRFFEQFAAATAG
ncbi:HAD family hydrolase [Bosea sp. F3-2]|uniref:HAD family hydrolase n=1 Tax=Bosea sp. F3-2 TaxID=2599640 RepID=UPI001655A0E6|nr:HAD family hydrolase [Bosea sp. F3-2]